MNALPTHTAPLSGCRVLVTRAAHQAGKLSDGLRAFGAEPVEVPVLEIQPPENFDALDRALREIAAPHACHPERVRLQPGRVEGPASESLRANAAGYKPGHQPPYDWLILTSANAVRAFIDRAACLNISLQYFATQVAAIGEATAQAAREAGFSIALVPESYVAESLIDKLLQKGHEVPELDDESSTVTISRTHEVSGHGFSRAENDARKEGALAPEGKLSGQRILLARAAVARDVIPDALRAAGATVDVVDAYRNGMPASAPARLRDALGEGIDAAAFTSSSSVMHLAEAAGRAGIAFPFGGVAAISIGPITSQTLRSFGWEPAAEASPSDVPGLIQAVARALAPR
ncbi:MAG TPA: uroporphyrinogen-III synthase [Terracidiphilus sp.]|jgi:uroporphyrinogen-III synthase/uroporphyrinogen III methyltransferase/synthase